MTAPTAEDVIAEAIHRSDCGCPDWHADDQEDVTYREHAAAVVAAIRDMSVEQQAELLGGEVTEGVATDGNHVRFARGQIEWVERP